MMATVAEAREFHAACTDGLRPMLTAIGGSFGPFPRSTLFAVGNRVRRAHTGAEVARRICGEGGVNGIVSVLFRDLLRSADRDLGDGTARLALMAGAALEAGLRALRSGVHPEQIIARSRALGPELDSAFDAVTDHACALEDVARTSGLDPSVVPPLVEAFERAGERGRVELVCGSEERARMSTQAGFVFDARPVEQDAPIALDDVHLLVADEKIVDFQTLAPVIEGFANRRKSLIIAARAVEGSARALIERNNGAGIVSVTSLVPQDQGERAAWILEDLAIATGAELVADRTGLTLRRLKPAMLGHARHYERDGQRVFLKGASGDADRVALRVGEIEHEVRRNRHLALDREHAERRRARLTGSWVELHLPETGRHSAEQALESARRALTALKDARVGGVIPGAGIGMEAIARRIAADGEVRCHDAAECAARGVVAAALRAPAEQYRRNAGQPPRGDDSGAGGTYGNPVDPAGLSRDLLELALSFSLRLLSVERAVSRDRKASRQGEQRLRVHR